MSLCEPQNRKPIQKYWPQEGGTGSAKMQTHFLILAFKNVHVQKSLQHSIVLHTANATLKVRAHILTAINGSYDSC